MSQNALLTNLKKSPIRLIEWWKTGTISAQSDTPVVYQVPDEADLIVRFYANEATNQTAGAGDNNM